MSRGPVRDRVQVVVFGDLNHEALTPRFYVGRQDIHRVVAPTHSNGSMSERFTAAGSLPAASMSSLIAGFLVETVGIDINRIPLIRESRGQR